MFLSVNTTYIHQDKTTCFGCKKISIFRPELQDTKGVILRTYPPMKMEQTECSETLAYKIQTPGNYLEESIRYSDHGEFEIKKKGLITTVIWLEI